MVNTRTTSGRGVLRPSLGLLLVASIAAAGTAELGARVQLDVRKMMAATYSGNSEEVLSYMHPSAVEQLGGLEKAKEQTKAALQRLDEIGLTFDSLDFPSEPKFVEGKGRLFAVIPTRIVVSAGDRKAEVDSFQIGVRDEGSTDWKYVEGRRFTEMRAAHFADFPADIELPKIERRSL